MEAAEKQLTDAERKLRTKEEVTSALTEQLRGLRRETEAEIESKERRILELQQGLKVWIHSLRISIHLQNTLYM